MPEDGARSRLLAGEHTDARIGRGDSVRDQDDKAMGFNGARKHQKLEDPRYLYWADRMGSLVWSEVANAYLFDEAYVQRFTREWMESMERDYNHPSIIMWVQINESWVRPICAIRGSSNSSGPCTR
jgi:beta-galactosidase/beta-glucuronidase